MKYKVKDKVKIKTWKEMEKEYGVFVKTGSIDCKCLFTKYMGKGIEELNCDRILTIDSVKNDCYTMKEITWNWTDDMIKYLVKDESEPINSRFEILDIR